MPVKATIISDHHLVYSGYTGIIQRQDIVTELMRVYNSDGYQPGMNELVDLRRVTDVQISYAKMSEHVRQANLTHRHLQKPIKVSFWAEDKVAFGMARMFQSLADALNSNMTCFVSNNRTAALSVLCLPASALESILDP
ncbi:hypothetical protein [uncultured Pelagimonas sp.]|uniref:hypothetical protein n=1 Tax=uncultured Pelagimonas sp. TaxID=1618102 RepID=UPI0026375B6D|nr:hypothetical protein [uncultured Pelagimonas sp.]